jgi:hypothetical protein
VIVFVAVSVAGCAGAFNASSAIFYPEQTRFPNGQPPEDFTVVVGDRAIPSIPFRYVRWAQAGEIAAKNPAALRLSRKEWSAIEVGDPWEFKVEEESPAHQVVSLEARSMMYGARTRYRVEGSRVTPLAYKTDGGFFHLMLLAPVFVFFAWLAVRASLLTSRAISRKLSPRPEAS